MILLPEREPEDYALLMFIRWLSFTCPVLYARQMITIRALQPIRDEDVKNLFLQLQQLGYGWCVNWERIAQGFRFSLN